MFSCPPGPVSSTSVNRSRNRNIAFLRPSISDHCSLTTSERLSISLAWWAQSSSRVSMRFSSFSALIEYDCSSCTSINTACDCDTSRAKQSYAEKAGGSLRFTALFICLRCITGIFRLCYIFKLRSALGHTHHGRTQNAFSNRVTFLNNLLH